MCKLKDPIGKAEFERQRQIKKFLAASTPEQRRRIRQRGDEGRRWRDELEGKDQQ